MIKFFASLLFLSVVASCTSNSENQITAAPDAGSETTSAEIPVADTILLAGSLSKQGVTTYQYGTHLLSGKILNGSTDTTVTAFALQSKVNLDPFIGKKVIVTGTKTAGYPLENGPDLIEVLAIEIDGVVKTQK